MIEKGAFEQFVSSVFQDAFDDLKCEMLGIKKPKRTWSTKWYEYECLEDHSYIYCAQDVNNGAKHNFKKGQLYCFRSPPNEMVFVVNHPDKFKFNREWIDVK